VDVEFGRGRILYALSQGDFPIGGRDGFPALPNTGALVKVNRDGTFTVHHRGAESADIARSHREHRVRGEPCREIWKIDNVSSPPFGVAH
jgi:hypothetical protein